MYLSPTFYIIRILRACNKVFEEKKNDLAEIFKVLFKSIFRTDQWKEES
jgi:hypothetical protein